MLKVSALKRTVVTEPDARGALDLGGGEGVLVGEIILVRISLILLQLIRAAIERLESGQSVAAEAAAWALFVAVGGGGAAPFVAPDQSD